MPFQADTKICVEVSKRLKLPYETVVAVFSTYNSVERDQDKLLSTQTPA